MTNVQVQRCRQIALLGYNRNKQGAVPGKGGLNPSTQTKSSNPSRRKSISKSSVVDSVSRRDLHNEANKILMSRGKSWGSWESSSQKKTIKKIPSIDINLHASGVDLRPMLNSETKDPSIHICVERRNVMISALSHSQPNYTNSSTT